MPRTSVLFTAALIACAALEAQTATTTSLTSVTPAAPLFGQTVTLTAQVVPASEPGAISFMDEGVLVGVGALNSSGIAQLTTISLPAGSHSLRAVYGGNTSGGYLPSQSAAQPYIVTAVSGFGFATPVHYATGSNPASVAVGDFNGDGRADLAVANVANTNTVSVLLGNADGTFQTAVNYGTGTDHVSSVAVGDFNGDGKPDLVIADRSISDIYNVGVLMGNGDGTFQNVVNYAGGFQADFVAVGDFNGDGRADLAVANLASYTVSVLMGNGNGTFQTAVSYIAQAEVSTLAMGDFNGDGKTDLATGVSVLLGNGDGTFQSPLNSDAGVYGNSAAVGDFNGDGKADLAVANGNTISVLLGKGDGTFETPLDYSAGINPWSVAVGDFNGDGLADLAVLNYYSRNVSVLLGNGDGTFQTAMNYGAGLGLWPLSVAVGDFNGDGRADLVTTDSGSDNVSVLLGQPPPVTVPNVVGLTQAAATSALTRTGLLLGAVTTTWSNSVPAGSVISEDPAAGTLAHPGSAVNLVVSSGPPSQVTVTSSPSGAAFTVSGAGCAPGMYTTPANLLWNVITDCTVYFVSPQQISSSPYVFGTSTVNGVSSSAINPRVVNSGTSALTINGTFVALVPRQVTVTSSPSGAAFTVSGAGCAPGMYTTPASLLWNAITDCTVYFVSPQQLSSSPYIFGTSTVNGISSSAVNPRVVNFGTSALTINAMFVVPLVAGTISPTSGSGAVQAFTGTYVAASGYQHLRWVQMVFAVNSFDGGGQAFCYVHYDVQGNTFWLYDDVRGFFVGPIAPGTASNLLQGSLCALNTSGSSVTGSGSQLTVNASVVFKQALALNIYMRAYTLDGVDTGFVQQGTWTTAAASLGTMTVSPSSGSVTNGTQQTFTLTFPDPPGFAGAPFGWEEFLVGTATDGGGLPFCFVHYDRAGNGLWMYSGDLGYFLGPVTPGTASNTLNSSACSVNTGGATVTNNFGNLVVTVPITLKSPMIRANKLFERTLDVLNRDTGFVQTGTFTVN